SQISGFYKIKYGSSYGYVSAAYIVVSGGGTTGGGTTGGGTTGGGTTGGALTVQATSNLNVRKGPGTGYARLGTLSKGKTVTVTGTSGDWYRITYGNTSEAYISKSYCKTVSASTGGGTTEPSGSTMKATANVNVRKGPGVGYARLGTLSKGKSVSVTGSSGSWYQVSYNGATGYISKSYLR
ncbi:MAG: SH3 domain-containing protein, partial [Eubacteriales bacterium]|nr:SH3 domain-containing protein [Eubacteriales bacterium]